MNKKTANPFNFTISAKISQIIYKGASEEITFGRIVNPYDPLDIENKNEGDDNASV